MPTSCMHEGDALRFVLIQRKISRKGMLGIALALLSAAISGFSVVIVGKHNKKSSALNISIVITGVGLAVPPEPGRSALGHKPGDVF